MFQIRQEQYDSMSKRAMDDFERRAIAYLHESHPECVAEAGEEEFAIQVRSSIQNAMKNGIDLEIFVVEYVQLDLESTPRLEPELYLQWDQIAADQNLEQVHKIERLRSLVYGLPAPPQLDSDEGE